MMLCTVGPIFSSVDWAPKNVFIVSSTALPSAPTHSLNASACCDPRAAELMSDVGHVPYVISLQLQ